MRKLILCLYIHCYTIINSLTHTVLASSTGSHCKRYIDNHLALKGIVVLFYGTIHSDTITPLRAPVSIFSTTAGPLECPPSLVFWSSLVSLDFWMAQVNSSVVLLGKEVVADSLYKPQKWSSEAGTRLRSIMPPVGSYS